MDQGVRAGGFVTVNGSEEAYAHEVAAADRAAEAVMRELASRRFQRVRAQMRRALTDNWFHSGRRIPCDTRGANIVGSGPRLWVASGDSTLPQEMEVCNYERYRNKY